LRGAMTPERRLRALYDELPELECLGLCAEACAYIGMTSLEQHLISANGGPEISMLDDPCPALNFMGRCSVYEDRPLICRLWGIADDMPCHYGCKPSRQLTRNEGFDLLRRAREISGDHRV
jgi:uncharacterized protein